MGSDDFEFFFAFVYIVSIHAPAWGATNYFNPAQPGKVVSIHAPAWGATVISTVNPLNTGVSIHAPAWGATLLAVRLAAKS